MRRYARALWRLWSASLQAELEYRANFVIACLTSAGTLAGTLFALGLFYQNDFKLGGWEWAQALLVMGFYTFLDGLQTTFLIPNYRRFSEYVRDGTLDFILLKPIDSQFFVSFRNLSLWGLPNLVLGAAIVVYAGMRNSPPLDGSSYALGTLSLALGALVLYALSFALNTLTIWFVKLWNITIALQSLLQAGQYPIGAYPPSYRIVLTYLIPVAFLTTVPAEAMTGRGSTGWLVAGAILAFGLLAASRAFWRYALRSYTSASS